MQADLAAHDARHRSECARCYRPDSECYCATLATLTPRTTVLLLQHPRERTVAIGTALMTHLGLTNSLLRRGVSFAADTVVQRALHAPTTALLFPAADISGVDAAGAEPSSVGAESAIGEGEESGAIARANDAPVDAWAEEPPKILIVIDGTWSQARKMIRENPQLLKLPRVGLRPSAPGNYRIRREPHESFLSTVEAVSQTLQVWEGPAYKDLLRPFDFLVSRQVEAQERHSKARVRSRHGRPRDDDRAWSKTLDPGSELFRFVYNRSSPLVVYAEANRHPRESRPAGAPELVHLVAGRLLPLSDEQLRAGAAAALMPPAIDLVVKPLRRTAPFLEHQIGLSPGALAEGTTPSHAREALAQVLAEEKTTVCFWGQSARDALAVDIRKFGRFVDIRALTARALGRSAGGLPAAHAAVCHPNGDAPLADDPSIPRAVLYQRFAAEMLAALIHQVANDNPQNKDTRPVGL